MSRATASEGSTGVAGDSLADLSELMIDSDSGVPPSVDDSKSSSSRHSEAIVGHSLTVEELPAIPIDREEINDAGQPSGHGFGVAAEKHQDRGQDKAERSVEQPMASSLPEERAGLQLEPAPLLAPRFDGFGDCTDENRPFSSPSIGERRDMEISSPEIDASMAQSDRILGGRKGLYDSNLIPAVDNGFSGTTTMRGNESLQESQTRSYSLIGDDVDNGDEDEDEDEVMIDPLAMDGENDADRLIRLGGL